MKISELIQGLATAQAVHGDVEVHMRQEAQEAHHVRYVVVEKVGPVTTSRLDGSTDRAAVISGHELAH